MATVTFEAVSKVYPNGHVAVDQASFEVADGERLVLVGPSGCGKSTLLRMIAGLEDITHGTLRIGGRVMNDVAPKDRDIAMVFQSYALYPHMSVADNLSFALRLRGMPAAERAQRVAEAAAMLQLEPLLDRKPAQLSGGQRQRVALGRALVRKPQVFLLDEPLSNLDAKLRASTRVEIARIHARTGTTMVYVTHDQVEAMTLGERIVVMRDGRIQQIDKPMVLYRQPANRFVAGFLGSPAMNFIEGRIGDNGGITRFIGDDGSAIDLRGQRLPRTGSTDRLVLGLRPEHLQLADARTADLHARLEAVEPVGNEVFAILQHGAGMLTVRLPPVDLPEPGNDLPLRLAPDSALFFADSGERLPA